MAKDIMKWTLVLLSIVVGLGFVLNTRLIPMLPVFLHYIFGIIFILLGAFIGYKSM